MVHRSVAALAALLLVVSAAPAQLVTFKVFDIDGQQVVPATNSPGMGAGQITLNTSNNTVSWETYADGLMFMVTASHFHGPAAAGATAPALFPLGHGNPAKGEKQVTAQQVADLWAGKWYADYHTNDAMFPKGEVRGQVIPTILPWFGAGYGVQGVDGKFPRLAGEGPLTANSPNKVTLSNAKANAKGILYIGNTAINKSFKGGVMVPAPDQTPMFTTDAQGMHVYNFHWPAGVPKYTNWYWQAWVQDAAAVKGFSASNALRSTSG